jgi:hypothetical protein
VSRDRRYAAEAFVLVYQFMLAAGLSPEQAIRALEVQAARRAYRETW